MAAKDILLTLLINLIWGLNVIVAKYGVGQIPPILFTFLRFTIVAVVLLPVLKIHRGQMPAIIFVAVATGCVHFTLTYLGLALAADVSSVAIAMQLGIPFATILSMLFLGEKIRVWRWLGLSMAFGGIMLIGFDPQVFAYRNALALVVLGALFGAGGLLVAKKLIGVGVFELQSGVGEEVDLAARHPQTTISLLSSVTTARRDGRSGSAWPQKRCLTKLFKLPTRMRQGQ